LVGFSTGDAPVIDILHTPYDIREKLEKIVKRRKRQLDELIQVASELALSDHGYTYRYDSGFGESKYYKWPIQYDGLYNIRVLAKYGDFTKIIPSLIDLLSEENERLNLEVCWTLRNISEKNKANAKLILDYINSKVDSKILQDKEVQGLIQECRKQKRTVNKKNPRKSQSIKIKGEKSKS
jgi:hypothetical protein